MNCPVCNKLFTKKSGVWQDDKSKQVCLTVGDILHNRDILRVVTTNDKDCIFLKVEAAYKGSSCRYPRHDYACRCRICC